MGYARIVLIALIVSDGAWATCTLPTDHQQYVNITACGATTASSDNQSSINAALAAASGQFPGIYVPPGIFATSGNHQPPAGVAITGSGTLQLTASSSSPIVDITQSGNTVSGLTFDLSKSTGTSRVAIDIDGGSVGTVVNGVTTNYGRIIAYVTNGGAAPSQIKIINSTVFSAITGGISGGAIEMNSGASHFSIEGNRVNGNWNGTTPGNGIGIAIQSGSNYGAILGNDSYANTGNGIWLHSGQYISVANNNVTGNQQDGIGVNTSTTPLPGRLSITGNIINQNVFDGIDVNESSGTEYIYIEISANYLGSNGSATTGGTGVYIAYAANVVVSGNTMFNNATAGIALNTSQNVAIAGNSVANNSQNGSSACSGAFLVISRCPGILLYNSTYNTVSGNVSTNNGGSSTQSYGIQEIGTSDYNAYTGNNDQINLTGTLATVGAHDTVAGNL